MLSNYVVNRTTSSCFNVSCYYIAAQPLTTALGGKGNFMSWPNDADGDVFRRLEENGFEFSKPYAVDYNVEFTSWPPAEEALDLLRNQFGKIEVCDPDGEGEGYVLFQVTGPVSYEAVTSVQRRVSVSLKPFGGTCESWGVLH